MCIIFSFFFFNRWKKVFFSFITILMFCVMHDYDSNNTVLCFYLIFMILLSHNNMKYGFTCIYRTHSCLFHSFGHIWHEESCSTQWEPTKFRRYFITFFLFMFLCYYGASEWDMFMEKQYEMGGKNIIIMQPNERVLYSKCALSWPVCASPLSLLSNIIYAN